MSNRNERNVSERSTVERRVKNNISIETTQIKSFVISRPDSPKEKKERPNDHKKELRSDSHEKKDRLVVVKRDRNRTNAYSGHKRPRDHDRDNTKSSAVDTANKRARRRPRESHGVFAGNSRRDDRDRDRRNRHENDDADRHGSRMDRGRHASAPSTIDPSMLAAMASRLERLERLDAKREVQHESTSAQLGLLTNACVQLGFDCDVNRTTKLIEAKFVSCNIDIAVFKKSMCDSILLYEFAIDDARKMAVLRCALYVLFRTKTTVHRKQIVTDKQKDMRRDVSSMCAEYHKMVKLPQLAETTTKDVGLLHHKRGSTCTHCGIEYRDLRMMHATALEKKTSVAATCAPLSSEVGLRITVVEDNQPEEGETGVDDGKEAAESLLYSAKRRSWLVVDAYNSITESKELASSCRRVQPDLLVVTLLVDDLFGPREMQVDGRVEPYGIFDSAALLDATRRIEARLAHIPEKPLCITEPQASEASVTDEAGRGRRSDDGDKEGESAERSDDESEDERAEREKGEKSGESGMYADL